MVDLAYPDAPGSRGTDTSLDAAAALAPHASRLQRLVLGAIVTAGGYGCTTNEAADALGLDRGSVQPRTSEMRLKRLILDSGRRRPNANGKSAIVWVAREVANV